MKFWKYQGTGNDFVMLDQRRQQWVAHDDLATIQKLCDRRFGIGADGLILLEKKRGYDFEMVYFNSDGSQSFCGNGSRCAVAFARQLGAIQEKCRFWAIDGEHEAKISSIGSIGSIGSIDSIGTHTPLSTQNNWVELKMKDVRSVERSGNVFVLNTGSPHYVRFENDLDGLDIVVEGKKVRYSDRYKAEGINVNLACANGLGLSVQTYERGVEDETYSCGTGVTAAAIAYCLYQAATKGVAEIPVKTKGGDLSVRFQANGDGTCSDIWLCGPAEMVFGGNIAP